MLAGSGARAIATTSTASTSRQGEHTVAADHFDRYMLYLQVVLHVRLCWSTGTTSPYMACGPTTTTVHNPFSHPPVACPSLQCWGCKHIVLTYMLWALSLGC